MHIKQREISLGKYFQSMYHSKIKPFGRTPFPTPQQHPL